MPKKLLLADDSVTIQRVIELTFAGEDVQVLAVGDGEEAIARIPIEKPDIILADIGMPKRNGYEVSAFVKGNPELEKIPVLLLAGAFEPVDEAKAKEAKCDGVLVKPFEPHNVIARVRELIGGAKGSPTQAVRDIPRPAAALAPPRPVELPRREERPTIPDDLMDMGADDLLPREDMQQTTQDVDMASQPIVLDDSLDDYFDKLDEAFATINTSASTAPNPPGSEARPQRPDRPVLERDLESFDEPPMMQPAAPAPYIETPRSDATDPFAAIDDIDEIIAATGARPDLSLSRELRVRLDPLLESTDALAPLIDPNVHSCGTVRPHGHRELAHPEPGFYAIGAKSYGRAPNFLMATGYEQARSVVAALAGDLVAADDVQLELPETGVCSSDFTVDPGGRVVDCCGGHGVLPDGRMSRPSS